MIRVSVRLAGPLRNFYKGQGKVKVEEIELAPGSKVAHIMEYYDITSEKVRHIVVSRRKGDIDTILKDGDEVRLVPLAAGG